MFMMFAESKMLWAVTDTLNQDFKPSWLIGSERAKQARFNLTETMGSLVKFKFKIPTAPMEQRKPYAKELPL